MSTEVNGPIDTVGLREELSKLTYDKLKERAEQLGVIEVWKNGVNKQTAVENIIKAYTEKLASAPVIEQEEGEENAIPEGEYDIDEQTLIDYPELVEAGFSIGDVLVVEAGKPWSKKDLSEGTEGIISRRTPEEADKIIKEANNGQEYNENLGENPVENGENPVEKEENSVEKPQENPENQVKVVDVEEVSGEYQPEVIDETLYSEEELLENIEICQANTYQALPETRIKLLRKMEALNLALQRKRK